MIPDRRNGPYRVSLTDSAGNSTERIADDPVSAAGASLRDHFGVARSDWLTVAELMLAVAEGTALVVGTGDPRTEDCRLRMLTALTGLVQIGRESRG